MSRSRLFLPVFALLALGCKPPPEAPTELDELSAYLFRNWETEEEGVLEVGMYNLRQHFSTVELDVGFNDRSYQLSVLADTDFDEVVVIPDGADPADCLGVGVVAGSAFDATQQTEAIIQADQTPIEPNSPNHYDRIFLDPTDPSCFPDRSCLVLRTNNDLRKENALMDIPYEMIKDFRWVELSEDGQPGTGEWGILARTWVPERGVGESGNNTIEQSYSIDVVLPAVHGGYETYRYMGLWSESTGAIEGEDLVMGAMKMGMSDLFDQTDEWLEENL
jgi:hypothetical protein